MPFAAKDKLIVEKLIEVNPDFKRLFEEHQELDEKVAKLFGKKTLSPQDEIDLTQLKKLKLKGRDEMWRILKEYKADLPTDAIGL